jgi:hypothetical protein
VLIVVWAVAAEAAGPVRAPGHSASRRGTAVAPAVTATEPKTPEPAQAAPSSAARYLEAEDGRRIALPPGATLEEFQRWLESRSESGRESVPEFGITWTALEGRADDERALLDATVTVQVLTDEAWVQVPLQFQEAILRSTRHKGPGEAQFEPLEAGDGYHCWLRGEGEHELSLALTIPLRKASPGRRLQLSTPQSAGGSLRLTVPTPAAQLSVSAQPAERLDQKVVRGNDGASSTIEVYGLTGRLDLTWQAIPSPKQIRPVLQAATVAVVQLAGDSVLLNPVTQRIQALQGSVSRISVRIPRQFNVLQLLMDGRESSGQLEPGIEANEFVVRLPEATTGPVELRWVLEGTLPASGELRIDGFQVRDALLQTGEIVVEPAEGQTVTQLSGREVRRTNAVGSVGASERASAYRFLKQPFELVLDVQEVEPYFTVTPRLFLRIGHERAELLADLDVEVYRGAVRELELLWPAFRQGGWRLDGPHNPALIENVRVEPAGRVRIGLLQRHTHRFRVPLRASRPITIGAEPFNLGLPVPIASNRNRTILIAARDDEISLRLDPAEGTVLRELPERLANEAGEWLIEPEFPEEYRRLQRIERLVDSESHTLQVHAAAHPPQLLAETISAARIAPESAAAVQTIQFDVDFQRVSQIHLLVPRALQGQVNFELQGDDAVPLYPTWTGGEESALRQVRLGLPEPRIGRFEVVASFEMPLPEATRLELHSSLRIPLILCAETDYISTRFSVEPGGEVDVTVSGEPWKPQFAPDGSSEWIASGTVTHVPVSLRRLESLKAPELAIDKALVRSQFGPDGTVRTRAQYLVARSSPAIEFRVSPASAEVEDVWWDDERLSPGNWKPAEADGGEFRIALPNWSSDADEHLLTIDLRSKAASPFHWSAAHRVAAPEFASDVWVDETVWEITLPVGQHLFAAPRDFRAEFHWERDGLYWSRRPDIKVADLSRWMRSERGPEPLPASRGNVYHFSRFGPAAALEIRSMAQSLVVLCGAGLALAGSFVLLKIPALRTPLTLLAAATAIAVAGLWYSTPVELLLQPAILGLVLAAGAAWIDGRLKRRRAPFLTFSSPSDFVTPPATSSSSHQRGPVPGIGSEEPTALRPARPLPAGLAASSAISGDGE